MTRQDIINIIDGNFSEETKLKMLTKVVDSLRGNDAQVIKDLMKDSTYGTKITNYLITLKKSNMPLYANSNFNIEDIIRSKVAFTFFFGKSGSDLENFIIHIDNDIDEVLNTSLDLAGSRGYKYSFSDLKKIDKTLREISLKNFKDDLAIHRKMIKFYEGRFEKNITGENGKFTRGYWNQNSTRLDMDEFYEKFINIQSVREDKLGSILSD